MNQKFYKIKIIHSIKIDFFKELDVIAEKNNFLLIYRPHMNDYVPKEIISYLNYSKIFA